MKVLILVASMTAIASDALAADNGCAPYLDQEVGTLRSSERINLRNAFVGKPLLVVNTASHCGFTHQFAGLDALYQTYRHRDVEVLGAPSNDFRQAARDEETAARVCYVNFGATFTMLAQQHVRGPNAHAIFQELGRKAGAPSWNFSKYLLDRSGKVVKRFESGVEPMSRELREAVEALL